MVFIVGQKIKCEKRNLRSLFKMNSHENNLFSQVMIKRWHVFKINLESYETVF